MKRFAVILVLGMASLPLTFAQGGGGAAGGGRADVRRVHYHRQKTPLSAKSFPDATGNSSASNNKLVGNPKTSPPDF